MYIYAVSGSKDSRCLLALIVLLCNRLKSPSEILYPIVRLSREIIASLHNKGIIMDLPRTSRLERYVNIAPMSLREGPLHSPSIC